VREKKKVEGRLASSLRRRSSFRESDWPRLSRARKGEATFDAQDTATLYLFLSL
jgi:hypothetical protein